MLFSGPPTNPSLADEALQGFLMLICGHFQGFCRDLYAEGTLFCAKVAPVGLQASIQAQFEAELRLNAGNPSLENIKRDYERFGFSLNLAASHPNDVTHLHHLIHWRNTVAHQKTAQRPGGVPNSLSLALVRTWKVSCNGLATALDDIMKVELAKIIGFAPW
jgi:hypothetical protein